MLRLWVMVSLWNICRLFGRYRGSEVVVWWGGVVVFDWIWNGSSGCEEGQSCLLHCSTTGGLRLALASVRVNVCLSTHDQCYRAIKSDSHTPVYTRTTTAMKEPAYAQVRYAQVMRNWDAFDARRWRTSRVSALKMRSATVDLLLVLYKRMSVLYVLT